MTERDTRRIRHRPLAHDQTCVVYVVDVTTGKSTEVYRTTELLLEAPNWIDEDSMILNGDGVLWRLSIPSGTVAPITLDGVPDLNNDHVPAPDPDVVFVSAYDGHIHRATLSTGATERITTNRSESADAPLPPWREPGWSNARVRRRRARPDGRLGVARTSSRSRPTVVPIRQLTFGARPADGCEFSPDGEWIYFNTEAFTEHAGHAQIARMRTDGSETTRLTYDDRVNWFPHTSPNGTHVCYLSYPPGTIGHPADLDVEIRLVADDWSAPTILAKLHGGQGTINVNSWAPDSTAFAYVAYPRTATATASPIVLNVGDLESANADSTRPVDHAGANPRRCVRPVRRAGFHRNDDQ